jgi:hypothetical protein
MPPVYLWRKASTNGHGQGVAQGEAALHRKGDSERLDLVMINLTTERCSTVPPRQRRYNNSTSCFLWKPATIELLHFHQRR